MRGKIPKERGQKKGNIKDNTKVLREQKNVAFKGETQNDAKIVK